MPKVKKSKGGGGGGEKSEGVLTLADQIMQGDAVRARDRVKSRDNRAANEDNYVDERLSRKILQQARIQQEELQTEYGLAPEKKKTPATLLGKTSPPEPHIRYLYNILNYGFALQTRYCHTSLVLKGLS